MNTEPINQDREALIERSIAGELGGTVEMNFDSQGLQGRLTLPLQAGA